MSASPPIEERTLLHVIRRGVENHPDRPAIADESLELSYRELWDRACRVAGGLRALGVDKGDPVLTMLESSADSLVLLVATSFIGAVLVPVNLAFKEPNLRHVISEAKCVAAVVDDHFVDIAEQAASGRLRAIVVRGPLGEGAGANTGARRETWDELVRAVPIQPVEARPDDVLAIIFTSGTTGPSKGVLTSHAQAYTMSYFCPHSAQSGVPEKFYTVTPMFHALGLFGGAFAPLIFGGSAYIPAGFSASRFWDDVRRVGATSANVVGTMISFLQAQPPRPNDREHGMQVVNMVPRPAVAAAFAERFGITATTSYGTSECGTMLVDWSDDDDLRSVGVPRDGLTVRLVDENDHDVSCGEVGELILRPEDPCVFTAGYVNNPEATKSLWRNGWFATGDLLRQDERGYLYFVDRVKDSIRRRGENISSVEVEVAVASHPEVLECAAVGIGDPADQEVMIVVIRAEDSTVTEADLIHFLIDRLPYYSVPRYVAFATDLPRTPTGKVRKVELRSTSPQAWDRDQAGIAVAKPTRSAARARI